MTAGDGEKEDEKETEGGREKIESVGPGGINFNKSAAGHEITITNAKASATDIPLKKKRKRNAIFFFSKKKCP